MKCPGSGFWIHEVAHGFMRCYVGSGFMKRYIEMDRDLVQLRGKRFHDW